MWLCGETKAGGRRASLASLMQYKCTSCREHDRSSCVMANYQYDLYNSTLSTSSKLDDPFNFFFPTKRKEREKENDMSCANLVQKGLNFPKHIYCTRAACLLLIDPTVPLYRLKCRQKVRVQKKSVNLHPHTSSSGLHPIDGPRSCTHIFLDPTRQVTRSSSSCENGFVPRTPTVAPNCRHARADHAASRSSIRPGRDTKNGQNNPSSLPARF